MEGQELVAALGQFKSKPVQKEIITKFYEITELFNKLDENTKKNWTGPGTYNAARSQYTWFYETPFKNLTKKASSITQQESTTSNIARTSAEDIAKKSVQPQNPKQIASLRKLAIKKLYNENKDDVNKFTKEVKDNINELIKQKESGEKQLQGYQKEINKINSDLNKYKQELVNVQAQNPNAAKKLQKKVKQLDTKLKVQLVKDNELLKKVEYSNIRITAAQEEFQKILAEKYPNVQNKEALIAEVFG